MIEHQRFVYFMRPVNAQGPVKIGTSTHPVARLEHYAKWSPLKLEIVATVDGGWKLESRLHGLFADLHSHHEWFAGSARIDAVINAINAGSFDASSLPEPLSVRDPAGAFTRILRGLSHRLVHLPQPPDEVGRAVDRLRNHLTMGDYHPQADVRLVWEYLEKVAPRPKAKTRPLVERFLTQKDAA